MSATIQHGGLSNPAATVAPAARTLGDLLRRRRDACPDRVASYEKRDGQWRAWSWSEVYDEASAAARGLVSLGVEVGDAIAILGPTSYEWSRFDLGGHLAGAVTIGVYPRQAPEQVRYLLEHSRSRVVFVADQDELQTVLEAARDLDSLEAIVPWQEALAEQFAAEDDRIVGPSRFRETPLDTDEVESRQEQVSGDDTAILVYTSGTTVRPKRRGSATPMSWRWWPPKTT